MKREWVGLTVAALVLAFLLEPAFCLEKKAAMKKQSAEKTKKAEPVSPQLAAVFSTVDAGNCIGCHQVYLDSMTDSKMLAGRHKEAVDDCFTCHERADLEKKHAGVAQAPGKVFRQRKYPNELCMNCHEGYETLVEKTKDSKAFTTVDGKVINPHNVPALGGTHAGKTECFHCHKMHKDKPPVEYCYGCHHPRQLNNCRDCHSKKG